jgi:hypothetical protein
MVLKIFGRYRSSRIVVETINAWFLLKEKKTGAYLKSGAQTDNRPAMQLADIACTTKVAVAR